jgi:hypothetical protein
MAWRWCLRESGISATEAAQKLLRSAACVPAVLEILIYSQVNSGSCAPAARDLPSLATLLTPLHQMHS